VRPGEKSNFRANPGRSEKPHGYSLAQGWQDIRAIRQKWRTVGPDWTKLDRVEHLMVLYSLSFWDATIVGACLDGGVTRLYTEDFGAYARIDGVEIVNPFASP
jgi:predicted nucleic acid-binding protein